MSLRFLPSLVAVLGAAPLCSCVDSVDIPEAPDMTKLAAIYAEPDGRVDEEAIEDAVEEGLGYLEAIYGLGRMDFVVESLVGVGEAVRDVAQEDEDTLRDIRGKTLVAAVCPGSLEERTYDEENGSIDYQVTFEDSALDDTVWGDFVECQFFDTGERLVPDLDNPSQAGPAHYDGSMDIYLGGPIPLKNLQFDSFLFRLDGTLELERVPASLAFDFQIESDGILQIRVRAIDGDVVFAFGDNLSDVGLQTAEGSFCCDFGERFCQDLEEGSCSRPQFGDRVIRW